MRTNKCEICVSKSMQLILITNTFLLIILQCFKCQSETLYLLGHSDYDLHSLSLVATRKTVLGSARIFYLPWVGAYRLNVLE